MNFGLAALAVLLGTWLVVRTRGQEAHKVHGVWSSKPEWWHYAAGILAIVLLNLPLFMVTWPFSGLPPLTPSDSRTHAAIAQAIALRGIPHGWVDVYQGGFPVGPHYPSVGWLLIAGLIKLGVPAPNAALAVGTAFILAVPTAAFSLALRAGAGFLPSLAGAVCLSCVSPANGFVGGYEAYWGKGLISQIVSIPFNLLLFYVVARAAPNGLITAVAALAVASHPQVTIAALTAMLPPLLAAWDRQAAKRYARAGIVAVLVGAALYLPGIATLDVPFGWPPMERFLVTGYSFGRLNYWLLDGDLLDLDRSPVLTTLWAGSMLIALVRIRRPAPRAVFVGSLTTMAFVVSGELLTLLGRTGEFLLTFVQPLRFVCLVPIAMTATIVVAIEEALPFLRHLVQVALGAGRSMAAQRVWLGAQASLFVAMVLGVWPARLAWAREVKTVGHAELRRLQECAAAGFDEALIERTMRGLALGRLWYEDGIKGGMGPCTRISEMELAASVPIAVTSGAGAHVGAHTAAFHRLDPGTEGVARRAESLGIRYLVLKSDTIAQDPGKWKTVAETRGVRVLERIGGTDTVGVGCVQTVWEGSNRALHRRIIDALASGPADDRLLDPSTLIELRNGAGEVREYGIDAEGCDPGQATVRETRREPGAYEVAVQAPSPVDVVFRAAAFPTWKVSVDGGPAAVRKVGPGFFAARVGPGLHRVVAEVSPLPGYGAGVLAALGLCAAMCVSVRDWRRVIGLVRGKHRSSGTRRS